MNLNELFKIGMDRVINEPLQFRIDGLVLNVGAGNKVIPGAIPLDYPEWDADRDPLPYANNSVAGIHAYHFLEHIKEPVRFLQDAQRVLMPGGVINIVVPYYTSQMQHHDLDHKHSFCEETWRVMLGNPYYNKNKIEWKFTVHLNVIMGVVERNLCLVTQLLKGN